VARVTNPDGDGEACSEHCRTEHCRTEHSRNVKGADLKQFMSNERPRPFDGSQSLPAWCLIVVVTKKGFADRQFVHLVQGIDPRNDFEERNVELGGCRHRLTEAFNRSCKAPLSEFAGTVHGSQATATEHQRTADRGVRTPGLGGHSRLSNNPQMRPASA
jgi:hypothetical protein